MDKKFLKVGVLVSVIAIASVGLSLALFTNRMLPVGDQEKGTNTDYPYDNYSDQFGSYISNNMWRTRLDALMNALPDLESDGIKFGGLWFSINSTTGLLERYSTLYIALVNGTDEQKSHILGIMDMSEGKLAVQPPEHLLSRYAPANPQPVTIGIEFVTVTYTENELRKVARTLILELQNQGYPAAGSGADIIRNIVTVVLEEVTPEARDAAKRIMVEKYGKEYPVEFKKGEFITGPPVSVEPVIFGAVGIGITIVAALILTRRGVRKTEKPMVPFVVTLTAGLLMISGNVIGMWYSSGYAYPIDAIPSYVPLFVRMIVGLVMLGWTGGLMSGWQGMLGHMGIGGWFFGMIVFGTLAGTVVLIGSFKMYRQPEQISIWGPIILIFSVLTLVVLAGFSFGAMLGIIGGVLAILWRP